MLARLRKDRESGEGGFTLIELLVVIIIIGILAAIAIPTFLNQRKKGWDSAMKSSLKDAATAQESYFTDNSAYTTSTANLRTEGWNASDKVTLTVTAGDANHYCMRATHSSYAGRTWYLTNDQAQSSPGAPYSNTTAGTSACT